MKQLGETITKMEVDGLGRDALVSRTRYVIEKDDVGLRKPHYLGFGHRDWAVTHGDIDKIIEVLGHGAWSFTGEMHTGEPKMSYYDEEPRPIRDDAPLLTQPRARDSVTPSAVPSALIPTPLPKAPEIVMISSTPGYWGKIWMAIKGEL